MLSTQRELAAVTRAAKRRAIEDAAFRVAIVRAVGAGCSLRAVATAAGISHPTVLGIVRAAREKRP